MHKQSGFTLIEIMVVLVILGLLATFLMPNIFGRVDEARVTTTINNIRGLEKTLQMYRLDNGMYPTTEQGLKALVEKPTIDPIPRNYPSGGYVSGGNLPKDAWDNAFRYRSPGEDNRDYEIISFGSDGKEGGEDLNADIKSFELN